MNLRSLILFIASIFVSSLALAAPPDEKLGDKSGEKSPKKTISQQIDEAIEQELEAASLRPQGKSPDGEFLRRVYLDLTGRTPSRDAVLAFLADSSETKREQLVDRLLSAPESAEHLADFWFDVLISTTNGERTLRDTDALQAWLRQQFEKNLRYDIFVQRLVRAQGFVDENGASAWSLFFNLDPMQLAATTTRLFMGAQIECAQCHDHPFADWKQDQFLQMAAYFARTQPRKKLRSQAEIAAMLSKANNEERRKNLIQRAARDLSTMGVYERAEGELTVNERGEPITGQNRALSKERKVIAPRFLFDVRLERDAPLNRREAFALRLTSASNPYFAKMAVNRYWFLLMGRGLVNPVDDLSDASVSTHPELLDRLAKAFVDSNYDVRQLLRAITLSRAYQRSSEPPADDSVTKLEDGAQDPLMTLYGRMPVRPIAARSLARAVANGLLPPELPNRAQVESQIIRTMLALDGNRSLDLDRYEETLQEALFLQNSPTVNARNNGLARDSFVAWLIRTQPDDRERITRLFLNILTRAPSRTELERYSRYVAAQAEAPKAYEDIVWVLLNSSEFRYNH